ncbi:MAG: ECF transporter S component [Bacilli bacterium]
MKNLKIRKLVFASELIAIILFLSFVPNPLTGMAFGYIPLSPLVVMTIIHIPVIIGAIVLGKKYGLILGTVFGLGSLVQAAILLGPNAPFTNPLLSVLPRMFLGYISAVYFQWFVTKFRSKNFATGLTLGLATLTHTVIVVPILYLIGTTGFYFTAADNPFSANVTLLVIFASIFTINGLLEVVLSIVIGLPIVRALNNVIEKTS